MKYKFSLLRLVGILPKIIFILGQYARRYEKTLNRGIPKIITI